MTLITWDGTGEKVFEAGVDHGVLYIPNGDGEYDDGVAWNGLITVTESPTGAESNKTYADNIVYANLVSLEEFEGSIDAYMYPTEFAEFDGAALPAPGLAITGQLRSRLVLLGVLSSVTMSMVLTSGTSFISHTV